MARVTSRGVEIPIIETIRTNRYYGNLNELKTHFIGGVNNDCANWIGGFGYLICIPLDVGSAYAIQIGFNEQGTRKYRMCIDGTNWTEWWNF